MNTSKEKFYALAKSESAAVDSLIDAMAHTRRNDARHFLMVMNSIVDFYLQREPQEGEICYPIIRVPHAPDWAQEVLLKFLILKLSLHYNSDTISLLRQKFWPKTVYIKDEKYHHNYFVPCKNYLKGVIANVPQDYLGEIGHKNIIFCSEGDMRVSREDKNKFVSEFYGNVDDIFTDKNLIMCQNLSSDDIRSSLREHREQGNINIDNAFVFYTNNEKINSLDSTSLERWNRAYHVGLKNCFVFDFSDDPFRLRYEIRRGTTLCKKLPMIPENEFMHYRHFILFDERETNFFFGWQNQYKHKVFEDDQLMFTDVLGSLLDESEYRIQERNRFSLCLSQNAVFAYQRHLRSSFEDYNNEDYRLSFDWQAEMSQGRITPALRHIMLSLDYASMNHQIAVVVDKSIPADLKTELTHHLQSINSKAKIKFYDYSALKPQKGKNSIKESCVIVMQYRPHYIRESYAKYPNSFDPYYVRKGQFIFDIIQGFAFQDMYAWDKYDYELTMYELLSSDYRDAVLGGYEKPTKPSCRRVMGETEFSDERGPARATVYVKGTYEDGTRFNIPETNFVIWEGDGERQVCRFSDLKRNDMLSSVEKFQEMDVVAEHLQIFIQKKQENANELERFIRNSYCKQGQITEEEQDSPIALWKILLAKKVCSMGLEAVYGEIKTGLKEAEQISENQFKCWADTYDNMMLPRSKVHQRKLFEYLGFGASSPYLFIMRSKKAATKNGTRKFNSMMDQFLSRTLTREIDDDLFDEIYNSDINDLLDLKNINDLISLIEMLREEIHLKTVKEIS